MLIRVINKNGISWLCFQSLESMINSRLFKDLFKDEDMDTLLDEVKEYGVFKGGDYSVCVDNFEPGMFEPEEPEEWDEGSDDYEPEDKEFDDMEPEQESSEASCEGRDDDAMSEDESLKSGKRKAESTSFNHDGKSGYVPMKSRKHSTAASKKPKKKVSYVLLLLDEGEPKKFKSIAKAFESIGLVTGSNSSSYLYRHIKEYQALPWEDWRCEIDPYKSKAGNIWFTKVVEFQ